MVYMEDNDNPYRQRIIRLTSQAVAVELLHALENDIIDQTTSDTSQKDRLFQRFMSILSRPTNTEREVRAYAEQLLVTSKYLSAVCKEKSGRTAMDWITENTVSHITTYCRPTSPLRKSPSNWIFPMSVSFANMSRNTLEKAQWNTERIWLCCQKNRGLIQRRCP